MENINYFNDPSERFGKVCPQCGSPKVAFLAVRWKDEWADLIKTGEIVFWTSCLAPPYNLICRDCRHMWAYSSKIHVPGKRNFTRRLIEYLF
ncbi:MAG: hypothetical protein P4L35_01995 [Ignavibacteriaceae bacterium]|nr:hypothetical protein [Ignavibacteriaceae bacterium]